MSIVTNKKATLNYEVLEKFEAGLELLGHEVKSIRAGKIKLDGSYVINHGDELFLKNAEVSPFQANNVPKGFDGQRVIKILVRKAEIRKLKQDLDAADRENHILREELSQTQPPSRCTEPGKSPLTF